MRIVFIGAGSFVFSRKLIVDLSTFNDLVCDELVLMDIDQDRLETASALAQKVLRQAGRPIKLKATTNRREALEGADYVIGMYEPHGLDACRREVMTCIAHGVPLAIGDTLNPSGIFKGVRTACLALEVGRDMAECCPNAIFLNYVNPLAINCWAMSSIANIQTIGMCHGLEHTRTMLAGLLQIPAADLQIHGAGVNHMTWLLEIQHHGEDLYPELRRRLAEFRDYDPVRFAIMEATGYFVTESSYHSAEYVPYFRNGFKSLYIYDKEQPGCNQAMGGWGNEDGEHCFIHPSAGPAGRVDPAIPLGWCIYLYEKHHNRYYDKMRQRLLAEQEVPMQRSEEYAMRIIHSRTTGKARTLSLNVPNRGYISNLPEGAVVELPVRVDGKGITPQNIGALPEPCASLCRHNIEVQSLVVEGIRNQDARAIFNAMLLDPLTAACLDLAGIRSLYDALIDIEAEFLPEWLARSRPRGGAAGTVAAKAVQPETKDSRPRRKDTGHTPVLLFFPEIVLAMASSSS